MNFDLKRQRSKYTENISHKNENTNSIFIEKLKSFGKYHLYPNSKNGIDILSTELNVDQKNICVGFGSESLLRNLFLTLDYTSIQMLEYSYEMALYFNNLLNKKTIINNISFNQNKFETNDIVCLGGEVLYLVSPHSPTGITYDLDIIKYYSTLFKYVIVDEAYINPSLFQYPIIDNVVYIRTFSKLGGVAGLRLGYAISSEEIIKKLNCLRDSYEINSDSIDYLNFIFKNKNLIYDNMKELKTCHDLLKSKNNCFSIHCGIFSTFESELFHGKKYKINDKIFTRVTLCDSLNYKKLYIDTTKR